MLTAPHQLSSPIGLVAGSGDFPLQFARSARNNNLKIYAAAHRGETDPELEGLVDGCEWLKVGQLGRLIKFFKSKGVSQAAFAGGIKKARALREFALDLKAILLLGRLKFRGDDNLLRAVAMELERSGIAVFSASLLLEKALAPLGLIAGPGLSPEQLRDARLGWDTAKAIGSLDIGQTVCVHRGVVTAVEALEGTDLAIERAYSLVGTAGVVVKTCKPGQDLRFDLPSVGPATVQSLVKAKAAGLILEAGKTLMLHPDEVRCDAQCNGITVIGADSAEYFKSSK